MAQASDDDLKAAVLEKALEHAPALGFSDALLARAGKEAGVGAEMLVHLFPAGPASLVEAFSVKADDDMERQIADQNLPAMKIRERIRTAALARIAAVRLNKEAARRAGAFLMMPANAALGARLVYRSVDLMWRAAGDTATDFNFYTKRGILAGVYSATLMRWFNDASADESETREFLDARIENVMQFEKFKAGLAKTFSATTAATNR